MASDAPDQDLAFESAGPRERVYFDPPHSTAAIVTCGGLCPGLNNVIRSAYMELRHNYGVSRILGIRNGYAGLSKDAEHPVIMSNDFVSSIHQLGGTALGSCRGPQDPRQAVDFLQDYGIDMLLCVGGDGTQRGAHRLYEEITRRGVKIAVIGIPKTIDNDIKYVYRTFGHSTALAIACEALSCAHVEAKGSINGIGLVKLMGRDAGFIAAGATVASQDVNFCLVPEIAFTLEGPNGLLPALKKRLLKRRHVVIAVAEGAGQHLFDRCTDDRDASGNRRYEDIGVFLKAKIAEYLDAEGVSHAMKYIDPSYLIRSVPANTDDRILSDQMARYAVHAAMAGNTDLLIGRWNNQFVHVPIPMATATKKQMGLGGDLWRSVLLTTGQPRWPAPGHTVLEQERISA
jgi:6-phosphofructokinase 1